MTEIITSILASVKRYLGIVESDCEFDPEIMMHINAALANLTQIGVGPQEGFIVYDNTANWEDFLPDRIQDIPHARLYTFCKVKVGFDSSNLSSTTIDSFNKLADECQYRLHVSREAKLV